MKNLKHRVIISKLALNVFTYSSAVILGRAVISLLYRDSLYFFDYRFDLCFIILTFFLFKKGVIMIKPYSSI